MGYMFCFAPVLFALAVTANVDVMWAKWKLEHGKLYVTVEEEMTRKAIWLKNLQAVHEINKQNNSYRAALNFLADKYINEIIHKELAAMSPGLTFAPGTETIPKTYDWRQQHVVSPVKNQGQCGNVEAIVAAECVESLHAIQTGQLVSLSTQQVLDCCCQGCVGPCPNVFHCIHKIGGLCTEGSYPPTPSKEPCNTHHCTPVAKIQGGRHVPAGNETALQMAVLHAPVMVLVDASHTSFQIYQAGIYHEPQCSSTKLDHALQVVGYGSQDGQDYWICRNSWGSSWGMKGYILMARNQHNMCGIASMAVLPV